MEVIYVNGNFYTNREDAKVSVFDHGFLYGDGVFEGIRVYQGNIFRFKEHMERLYDSAKTIKMEMPMTIEELSKVTIETVKRTQELDSYIRLVVSRGPGDLGIDPRKCTQPTIVIIVGKISLFPESLYDKGISVIIASTRKNFIESLNPNIKSLNYLNCIMAKIEAVHAGVPEAILININGYVTEGTADNIFVVKNGVVKTPPPYVGLLVGITRNAIMDVARDKGYKVEETLMTSHDLYIADEIFLSGTGAEMIPVIEVDGRQIGEGKPGPIFKDLLAGFRERTSVEGTLVWTKEEIEKMKSVKV